MNNFNNILAKPSGITLEQHIANVIAEANAIIKKRPLLFEKYESRIGKSLIKRLIFVCEHHDDGKAADTWQTACRKDYVFFVEWLKTNNGSYQDYKKETGAKSGIYIRNANFRHELESLKKTENKKMPLPLFAAIAAHHSKLSSAHEPRWHQDESYKYWEMFLRYHNDIAETKNYVTIVKEHYAFAGIRGLLQFADHRASAREENEQIAPLKNFKYKFPHKNKRGIQKLIENNWNKELLLIRAPTGSGKTDASLLWASLQIKNKKADRLIIAMPTRFTSNALAINVTETLSNTGLYHSSAWSNKYNKDIKENKITEKLAKKQHELARLIQTPATVCTIDHLLIALTLTREEHHQITFNIANSCVVIDEADFYDDFTQKNILVLLETLKIWNVPILLMSASLPESIIPEYKKLGFDIDHIIEDTSDNDRERFSVETITKYDNIEELEHLLELCIKKGTAIIYANTIEKALCFYNWFNKRNVTPILYHSRFTEPDKTKKERILINSLGRKAWERNTAKGIAILTQIGEMSINISADIMISDICPIDRLTQRAGRLCRFDNTKIGHLHIILPEKNGLAYPAPYGKYDKQSKTWHPVPAYSKTINLIKKQKYNAYKLVQLINIVYDNETEYSAKACQNAANLKKIFSNNWLIGPKQKPHIDDLETTYWKSRDINAQDIVFIKQPECNFFENYSKFNEWKTENSISLPLYIIDRAIKNYIVEIMNITIGIQKESIYTTKNGFYEFEKGIQTSLDDDFCL